MKTSRSTNLGEICPNGIRMTKDHKRKGFVGHQRPAFLLDKYGKVMIDSQGRPQKCRCHRKERD